MRVSVLVAQEAGSGGVDDRDHGLMVADHTPVPTSTSCIQHSQPRSIIRPPCHPCSKHPSLHPPHLHIQPQFSLMYRPRALAHARTPRLSSPRCDTCSITLLPPASSNSPVIRCKV